MAARRAHLLVGRKGGPPCRAAEDMDERLIHADDIVTRHAARKRRDRRFSLVVSHPAFMIGNARVHPIRDLPQPAGDGLPSRAPSEQRSVASALPPAAGPGGPLAGRTRIPAPERASAGETGVADPSRKRPMPPRPGPETSTPDYAATPALEVARGASPRGLRTSRSRRSNVRRRHPRREVREVATRRDSPAISMPRCERRRGGCAIRSQSAVALRSGPKRICRSSRSPRRPRPSRTNSRLFPRADPGRRFRRRTGGRDDNHYTRPRERVMGRVLRCA